MKEVYLCSSLHEHMWFPLFPLLSVGEQPSWRTELTVSAGVEVDETSSIYIYIYISKNGGPDDADQVAVFNAVIVLVQFIDIINPRVVEGADRQTVAKPARLALQRSFSFTQDMTLVLPSLHH